MTTYDAQIQTAVEEITNEIKPCVQLSTGVVLRFKKINILRIMSLVNKFAYPEVPKIFDKERGRQIDNPHDPVYRKAVEDIDNQRGMAMVDAILAFGTEIESVPENVPTVESDVWIDEVAVGGLEVNTKSPAARYLAWAKWVAVGDSADVEKITAQFNVAVGTAEGNVARSLADNFPNPETR